MYVCMYERMYSVLTPRTRKQASRRMSLLMMASFEITDASRKGGTGNSAFFFPRFSFWWVKGRGK